jgi:hypothetical protein
MSPTFVVALLAGAQPVVTHDVRRQSPTDAMAFVHVDAGPNGLRDLVLCSGVGPPASFVDLAHTPAQVETVRGPDGIAHVLRFGDLAPGGSAAFAVRVALPAGAGWAHVLVVDATDARTGARTCYLRSAGTEDPIAIPTVGWPAGAALVVALGVGLFLKMRNTRGEA